MRRQEHVHVVEVSFFDNGRCTTHPFFRRLKNQFHCAVQLRALSGQNFCHTKADGGVPVVSAGVHAASLCRGVLFAHRLAFAVIAFRKRQCIHIKPQRDHRPLTTTQNTDNASAAITHAIC